MIRTCVTVTAGLVGYLWAVEKLRARSYRTRKRLLQAELCCPFHGWDET